MTSWREQVESGISDFYAKGKTPKHEPKTEAEWVALQREFPKALFAVWFVLTGKRVG